MSTKDEKIKRKNEWKRKVSLILFNASVRAWLYRPQSILLRSVWQPKFTILSGGRRHWERLSEEKQSEKVARKAQWNKIDDNKTAIQENHCLNRIRIKRKNDIQISLGQTQNVLLLLLFLVSLFIFRCLRRWIKNEREWDKNWVRVREIEIKKEKESNWREEKRRMHFKRRNKLNG